MREAAETATFEQYIRIIDEKLPEYVDKVMEDLPKELEKQPAISSLRIFGRDEFFEAAGLAHIPRLWYVKLLMPPQRRAITL
jgi:hypothetical protein